jgi:hypothetical protein
MTKKYSIGKVLQDCTLQNHLILWMIPRGWNYYKQRVKPKNNLINPISWAHWASAVLHWSPSMAKTKWNIACESSVNEDNIRTDRVIRYCWCKRDPIWREKKSWKKIIIIFAPKIQDNHYQLPSGEMIPTEL